MFKFSIITDTHIRSPDGDLSSPFPVNEKANNRARYAIGLIKAMAPDFTVHLGDMVHPLPQMDAYQDAVAEAHRIFNPLTTAVYFVPGNHDIGDKPSPAMPAKPLSAASEQIYQSAFGSSRYSFEHQGVAFVVINSSLVNSATDAEQQQKLWLEEQLNKSHGKRIFLFSHYPPFINAADEVNHYDNYAEPGRSWLLDLAVKHRVEAIFSGHVHQFFYNVYQGVKLVCLPPTSFIRQDYAELYPTSPSVEFGRDDVNKYSVCEICVEPEGFNLGVIPTSGIEWEVEAQSSMTVTRRQSVPIVPHLRHAWFEAKHLPYNGPMEEFGRKLARNDYPLLRLLQLGIDSVRIPLSDLEISQGKQRVLDWHTLGIKFVVFNVGEATAEQLELMQEVGPAISEFELVCINGLAADRISAGTFMPITNALQCPVSLSTISTSATNSDPTKPYGHSVSSGFASADIDQVLNELRECGVPQSTSIVFQLTWGENPADALENVFNKLAAAGYGLTVNVRLANNSPAEANFNDVAIASALQEVVAWAEQKSLADHRSMLSLQCDTFEDIDRGYHPRHGLIDRQGNIRVPVDLLT